MTPYQRHFDIGFVENLRDLGGYPARDGRETAWRTVFRSGELRHDNENDVQLLKQETGIKSVLDLRGRSEASQKAIDLLSSQEIVYFNIPLLGDVDGAGYEDDSEIITRVSSIGEFYMETMLNREDFAGKLATALEIIADPDNQPVLFHCMVGKDRTGILAAAILNILGVEDDHILFDYSLTQRNMPGFLDRLRKVYSDNALWIDLLPGYMWEAPRESMELVLTEIRNQFGSFRNYLITGGCDPSLFSRLENTLLNG